MKQNRNIMLFAIFTFFAVLLSTLIALFSIRKISQEYAEERLHTLAKDIERSINDELTETINVSRTIANDTFLLDLLERQDDIDPEELDRQMTSYTHRLENAFSYQWVFVVSEKTKAYYSNIGLYDILDLDSEEDRWYKDFIDQNKNYEITLGRDNDNSGAWTVFADMRIEDDDGNLLGVCGIAMQLDDLQELIRDYEEDYGIEVLFVDTNGEVQLSNGEVEAITVPDEFNPEEDDSEQMIVRRTGLDNDYTIIKYIDRFGWYMIINNYNPLDHTVNVFLIVFNTVTCFLVILITVLCMRYVLKRNRLLFASSYRDELTGLLNRRAYEDYMNELRARDSLIGITVFVFDVNGLKTTNDTLGHSAGDELIRGMAQVLHEVFEPQGLCYRTGGDEFVVILERDYVDLDQVEIHIEQCVVEWKGSAVKSLSVSYGMVQGAQYPDKNVDELIALADEDMYWQKRNYYRTAGRDRRKIL